LILTYQLNTCPSTDPKLKDDDIKKNYDHAHYFKEVCAQVTMICAQVALVLQSTMDLSSYLNIMNLQSLQLNLYCISKRQQLQRSQKQQALRACQNQKDQSRRKLAQAFFIVIPKATQA
jgi:hypothetical protein